MEKEHQFVCRGTDDEPHQTENLVLTSRFGTAPSTPLCKTCGQPMGKVFFAPVVRYGTLWKYRNGR